MKELPTITWVRRTLRMSCYAPRREKVLAAFIVGSFAKGTAHSESDLDIAVIIPEKRRKTALQYTEDYHSKFPSDDRKPTFDGYRVDFQFFYPDDPILESYSKIPLT